MYTSLDQTSTPPQPKKKKLREQGSLHRKASVPRAVPLPGSLSELLCGRGRQGLCSVNLYSVKSKAPGEAKAKFRIFKISVPGSHSLHSLSSMAYYLQKNYTHTQNTRKTLISFATELGNTKFTYKSNEQ